MEAFFNHDLGAVRVHTDSRATRAASSLGAYAFTLGHDIAFAAGRHVPGTIEGSKLLAHELTHVVQQSRGVGSELRHSKIGEPGDAYEREADANAERFAAGANTARVTTVGTSGSVHDGETLQFYNGGAAASYAKKWAKSENPDFSPRFNPDCTNFVSQALLAGGWKMEYSLSTALMDGPGAMLARCTERKDNDVWWYNEPRYCPLRKVRASYTWGAAANLYAFMSASGRGTLAGHVADLDVGDVLQYDNGGGIHHSMIVTDKTKDNTFFSYHSNDTLNKPFWGPGGIHEGLTNASFYGWHL